MDFAASSSPDWTRQARATFHTATFIVAPITPPELRELAGELLVDEHLAAQLDWTKDKSKDGVLREAFLLGVCRDTGKKDTHENWRGAGALPEVAQPFAA